MPAYISAIVLRNRSRIARYTAFQLRGSQKTRQQDSKTRMGISGWMHTASLNLALEDVLRELFVMWEDQEVIINIISSASSDRRTIIKGSCSRIK